MMESPHLLRVVMIGSGNVATHLAMALRDSGQAEVVQVISPDGGHARALADKVGAQAATDVAEVATEAEFVIISTTDSAVADVAARLPRQSGVVVHTSGSVPMDVLRSVSDRVGVLYPLQTFSKDAALDMERVPFFTEGSDAAVLAEIDCVASWVSRTVAHADSARRGVLHIAGVLACNFPTYLLGCAGRVLAEAGLGLEVVRPLVEATVEKCFRIGPDRAQTGPARRGDDAVIAKHAGALPDDMKAVYVALSDAIKQRFDEQDSI